MPPRTADPSSGGLGLKEYLRVLVAHRYLAAGVTLVVFGAVMALTLRQTPQYEATARVLAPQLGPAGEGAAAEGRALDTEAEIVESAVVARRVIRDLDLDVPVRGLLSKVNAEPFRDTKILAISFLSPSPRDARDFANAYGIAYLDYRRDKERERIGGEVEQFEGELGRLQERLNELGVVDEADVEASRERNTLLTSREAARTTIASLRLALGRVDSQGEILDFARTPGRPARPNKALNGAFGLAGGLLLGIIAAFLADSFKDTLTSPEDIEETAGAPVLAIVPHVAGSERVRERGADGGSGSRGRRDAFALVEAMRTLRTNLQAVADRRGMRTVLITSPMAGEGKTFVASNLVLAFGQSGSRSILIDADLRRPGVDRFFKLDNRRGLSTVLTRRDSGRQVLLDPGNDHVRVVASGPVPPDPTELLDSPAMREFLDSCEAVADIVLLDSPPAGLADASVLAGLADGVLLVIRQETTRRALRHARAQLARVNSRVIGVVCNAVSRGGPAYYTYYGADQYGDGHKRQDGRRASRGRGVRALLRLSARRRA